MNVGTKIIGETLVYSISASFLLYEYSKSQIKENDRMYKIEQLQKTIYVNEKKTEAEIEYMKREIVSLKKKILKDICRNFPDNPYVDLFVYLFLRLILSIYLVYS